MRHIRRHILLLHSPRTATKRQWQQHHHHHHQQKANDEWRMLDRAGEPGEWSRKAEFRWEFAKSYAIERRSGKSFRLYTISMMMILYYTTKMDIFFFFAILPHDLYCVSACRCVSVSHIRLYYIRSNRMLLLFDQK